MIRKFYCVIPGALVACGAIAPTSSTDHSESSVTQFAVDATIRTVSLSRVYFGQAPGCDEQYRTIDYDRASQTATWEACNGNNMVRSTPSLPASSITLQNADAARLESILTAMEFTPPQCPGIDGLDYLMTTTATDATTTTYAAAFGINCSGYLTAPKIVDAYTFLAGVPH